jgi:hypothetical protein
MWYTQRLKLKANGFLLDDPIGARHNGYGVCMAVVLLRAEDQYEMLVESKHWRRGTITCPALPRPDPWPRGQRAEGKKRPNRWGLTQWLF